MVQILQDLQLHVELQEQLILVVEVEVELQLQDLIRRYNGGNGGSGIVVLRAPGPLGPSLTVAPGTNTKTTLPALRVVVL